jgi:hypothetical protein
MPSLATHGHVLRPLDAGDATLYVALYGDGEGCAEVGLVLPPAQQGRNRVDVHDPAAVMDALAAASGPA